MSISGREEFIYSLEVRTEAQIDFDPSENTENLFSNYTEGIISCEELLVRLAQNFQKLQSL